MLKETLALTEQIVFNDFIEHFDINGKDILEVGGHLPYEYFKTIDVKSWFAIDPRNKNGRVNDKYISVQGYAQLIPCKDNSFDYIFSCNAFQHIHYLDMALNEMYRVLKPGGVLYANFGPIWSAPDGSHIEDVHYKGEIYNFWDNIQIPSWGHLIFNCRELYDILTTYTEDGLAKKLSEYVYMSDWLNRLTYGDYKKIIEKSLFSKIIFFGGTSEFGYRYEDKKYADIYMSKKDEWLREHVLSLNEYKYRDIKLCLKK